MVRHLHLLGLTILSTTVDAPSSPIRRRILAAGGLVGASALLTAMGLTATSPEPDPVYLSTFTFGGEPMTMHILIAYATEHGSTMDVAAALGEALAEHGHRVDIRPVEETPDPRAYDAVVIGSAVQHGTWLPGAVDYARGQQEVLARIPVALFCVHIRNTGADAESRAARQAYLDDVRPYVQPVAEGFFAGRFNRRGAAELLPGWAARLVPTIDMRKWDLIGGWAGDLSMKLEDVVQSPTG
ncbi:MAG: flavodoxin domain-containing protein [Anaerolineae bacterium]